MHADAGLVTALARAFGEQRFRARIVIDRAGIDADVHSALDDACIETTRELGWLLRRSASREIKRLDGSLPHGQDHRA